MTDRKKPTAGFWTVALVVVLVGYPLSFGPACWVTSRTGFGASVIPTIYRPMTWAWRNGGVHRALGKTLDRYCSFGAADGWGWTVDPYVDDAGNLQGDLRWRKFTDD